MDTVINQVQTSVLRKPEKLRTIGEYLELVCILGMITSNYSKSGRIRIQREGLPLGSPVPVSLRIVY